jgi:putative FmdB family regulatory protein
MPTYEYECSKGHVFEVEQSITADPLKRCKICRAKVRRLISASHFILKGSGWYADGYGSSKKSSGGESSSDSKSEAKSETKSESKSEAKSGSKTDSKPAKTEKAKASSKAASGS